MKRWPFKVIDSDEKIMIEVNCNGETLKFYPEQISAMVLHEMKTTAESRLGRAVSKAVITVPASFTDAQRQATKHAGEIAGLEVLRIINEPTAAALATNIDMTGDGRTVLIFDLGGGTFDVSILFICENVFEVKATKGDLHLGGGDFDNELVKFCVNEYKTWSKQDMIDKRHLSQLRIECEKAKITLSTASIAKVCIEKAYKGLDFNCEITRAYFEDLNNDLFKKTIDIVAQVLEDGLFRKEDIDDIVMVGGSSRIPKVRKMVQDFFEGKELNTVTDPDEAVACGAARHAAKLGGETSDDIQGICLVDVTPLSLGIKVEGDIMSTIIEHNTPIPVTTTQQYTTVRDFQENVEIEILEGERTLAKDNNVLGRFLLRGITIEKRGVPKILVTMDIDTNGMMNISAVEKASNSKNDLRITNNMKRHSDKEISRMKRMAEKYRQQDENISQNVKAKLALKSYCLHMIDLINDEDFKHKVLNHEKSTILEKCDGALTWMDDIQSRTTDEYENRHKELEELINPIIDWSKKRTTGKGPAMHEVD